MHDDGVVPGVDLGGGCTVCTPFLWDEAFFFIFALKNCLAHQSVMWGGGGDRGAGARENRGRAGYGRRERKGREAGEKCETLFF